MKETNDTCKLAVITGNIEIINILHESGHDFGDYLDTAIEFHRNEIADWILSNYETKELNPTFCLGSLNIKAFCYCIYNNIGNNLDLLMNMELFDLAKISLQNGNLINDREFQSILQSDDFKTIDFLVENSYSINNYQLSSIIRLDCYQTFEKFFNNHLLYQFNQNYMLLEAMKQGSQKIFEFLFKKGAKIHFQMNQNTILRSKLDIFKLYCSALAKSDLDKFLIEKINEIEPQKAKILLELGANANTTMICKMNKSNNTYEESLLILSIKRKCFELVDYLINNGANINDKINNKKSLIIYALESQSYKIIQYLLDLGVDINGKDQFGKESLLYALNTGTDEIMTMLIRHGLDIKGIHENQVLREKMITRFSESTLEVLLDKYPGYFNEPKHGHPMLYYAVINHSYEKVRVILDHDFKMNNHLSIFIDAYKTGDIEIFILLLQSYKELDFKKKSDENIINMALKLQSNETLDILVEKGYLNCINIEQLYTKFMIEFNKNEYLKHFIHVLKSKKISI